MKIAAYCRVSTDKEDQANSFESQQRFFYEYITGHPDWSLFEIYADEGITGTSVKKRTAFQRMMRDAEHRCFDLIVTKEISRFARNTLDSIYYTRKLKSLGVGVLFLNDNLNTLQEDSELILAIKSTIAQEESRATSSRVKWGQTRRMEQGVVFGRSLLGYDVVGGKMIVNPEGAAIVRLIFHKYVTEQKGSTTIARELERAGIPTLTGSTRWRSSVILKILRNEKYCGDLKQKKTITPDYLTHRKKYNHGEEAFVFLKDHHEPIVSREVWEQAQRELQRRNVKEDPKTGHGNRYPLSGKSAAEYAERALYPVAASEKMGARIGYGVAGLPPQAHSRLPSGGSSGCDVGCQLSDELAFSMVSMALHSLAMDRNATVREAAHMAAAAETEPPIPQIQSNFSGNWSHFTEKRSGSWILTSKTLFRILTCS